MVVHPCIFTDMIWGLLGAVWVVHNQYKTLRVHRKALAQTSEMLQCSYV